MNQVTIFYFDPGHIKSSFPYACPSSAQAETSFHMDLIGPSCEQWGSFPNFFYVNFISHPYCLIFFHEEPNAVFNAKQLFLFSKLML